MYKCALSYASHITHLSTIKAQQLLTARGIEPVKEYDVYVNTCIFIYLVYLPIVLYSPKTHMTNISIVHISLLQGVATVTCALIRMHR